MSDYEEDCRKNEVWSEHRGKCVKKKKIKVTQSYEIVTEDSASLGDVAERGWEDEEGKEFDSIDEVAEYLSDEGVMQGEGGDDWWVTEAHQDMFSGEYRSDHYHVKGADPEELGMIDEMIKKRRNRF